MIRVTVLFLGPARDYAKAESVLLELWDGATLDSLREQLAATYAELRAALPTIRLAVNEEFTSDHTVLESGDVVALIPPVSGGSSDDDGVYLDLVLGPIPVDRVRGLVVGDPMLGGIVTFEGATRTETDDTHGPLVRLEYEAYETMARAELQRLAAVARERWSVERLAIVHRLGAVPPGEVSVMIAVATKHRHEAFEACRWLIDTLKADVPIWKKDVFADGFERWVESGNE